MIELSRRAAAQLDSLLAPFSEKKRPEAMRNLLSALREARDAIQANPDGGLTATRPYPTLAKPICLMAVDFRKVRDSVLRRYPFLESTAEERRAIFEDQCAMGCHP